MQWVLIYTPILMRIGAHMNIQCIPMCLRLYLSNCKTHFNLSLTLVTQDAQIRNAYEYFI